MEVDTLISLDECSAEARSLGATVEFAIPIVTNESSNGRVRSWNGSSGSGFHLGRLL